MKKYYGAFSFAFSDWLEQQRWDESGLTRGDSIEFNNIRGLDGTRITYRDKAIKDVIITYEDDDNFIFTVSFTYMDGTYQDVSDDGAGDIWWQDELDHYCNFGFSNAVRCYADFVLYPDEFDDIWKYTISKNDNIIYLFRLNSPKYKVDKNLTLVGCMPIKFNNVIKYRDMEITMKWGINDDKFNYVYISSLKRYYFVNDKVLTNDIAVLQLHEDVSSSFADLIRKQTAFINRNQFDYNAEMVDNKLLDLNKKSYTITEYKNDFFFVDNLERYSQTLETSSPVLVVSGGTSSFLGGATTGGGDDSSMELTPFPYEPLGQGNVTIYTVNPTVLNYYLTGGYMDSIKNIFNDVGQYLQSLRYYPFDVTKAWRTWFTDQDITIGGVNANSQQSGYVLKGSKLYRMGEPVSLAKITINRVYNDFRDYPPYTRYKLYLPYISFIELNTDEIVGNTINVRYAFDFLDGTVQAYIMLYDTVNNKDIRLLQITDRHPIAIEMPLNNTNNTERAKSLLMGSIGLIGGAVTQNATGKGGLNALKSSFGSFMNAISVNFERGKIVGGLQAVYNPTSIFIVRESVEWADDYDIARLYGKPLCESRELSEITGYTEIGEIHFFPLNEDIYDDEIEELIDIMHTGVIL